MEVVRDFQIFVEVFTNIFIHINSRHADRGGN